MARCPAVRAIRQSASSFGSIWMSAADSLPLRWPDAGYSPPKPNPDSNGNTPDRAAAALAAGLSAKDLSPLPFVGSTGTAVNDAVQAVGERYGSAEARV